jgi:hypothetical protein
MGIASWVILSNAFETEADEVVVYKIQKQTILEQNALERITQDAIPITQQCIILK